MPSSLTEYIFATSNLDKVAELRNYQKQVHLPHIKIVDLGSLEKKVLDLYNPIENGHTFLQNSFIKARDLQKLIKVPVIAEDSGLMVQALNNEPGVLSARLAATSQERNKIILDRLRGVPYEKRDARFFACICFLDLDGNATFFNGTVTGKIAEAGVGQNGFGFDPIFYYPPWQKTFAEVDVDTKQTLSHRGLALKRLFNYLSRFYS